MADLLALAEQVADDAREALGPNQADAFLARVRLVEADLLEALVDVYGAPASALARSLVGVALAAASVRPAALRRLDRRREIDPTWFLSQDMIGYVCYADRFAGTLSRIGDHVDYLADLGVRYLHLMPLLRPREGESDGGYAVADYESVDPRLGTMRDLEELAARLHRHDMALCVDLVLNHTAREHAWAQAAAAGDPEARGLYRFFPDRTEPDAYEQTLPEVFPDMAPGSFTELDTGEWVWTTFHEFQWDLDWSNPEVLRRMLGVLLGLANRGVDVLRLDAAPFLWKRLGTDCQNQPEAHRLLQVLRALTRVAAPGVVLKAEAIVGPDQLVPYLGGHERFRPECDLAYDNQLMVMLWSSLATRDARLATRALGRRTAPPAQTGWISYVRCHDDIGWAVGDEDAWAVGLDPFAHRRFLADFFAGRFEGSFAEGMDFQFNPETGDARTCGSAASLAGVGRALALGDAGELALALRRLELLYAVVYSFGGIPLVYMGDELALRNDAGWDADPAHADDTRWLHRPVMDWAVAARRHVPGTPEAVAFSALQSLGRARRSTPALRSDASVALLEHDNPHVLAYRRTHPRAAPVVVLANFSDDREGVSLAQVGLGGSLRDLHSSRGRVDTSDGRLWLEPWGHAWVSEGSDG